MGGEKGCRATSRPAAPRLGRLTPQEDGERGGAWGGYEWCGGARCRPSCDKVTAG